jgi:hypothetical protein
MNVNHEVITLSVLVTGTMATGATSQEIVSFKVFREQEQFRAVPMLDEAPRKRAGLPEVICFAFVDHCIISEKSRGEETLEVIKSLIQEMMIQELIY